MKTNQPHIAEIPVPKGLTLKNIRFIDAYIANNHDPIKAYRYIYPAANRNTARVNASRILCIPGVKEYLKQRLALISDRSDIDRAYTIQSQRLLNDFDPAELFDSKGNELPLHKVPEATRKAILGYTSRTVVEKCTVEEAKKWIERVQRRVLEAEANGDDVLNITVTKRDYRFPDKSKTHDQFARTLGMYNDRVMVYESGIREFLQEFWREIDRQGDQELKERLLSIFQAKKEQLSLPAGPVIEMAVGVENRENQEK